MARGKDTRHDPNRRVDFSTGPYTFYTDGSHHWDAGVAAGGVVGADGEFRSNLTLQQQRWFSDYERDDLNPKKG